MRILKLPRYYRLYRIRYGRWTALKLAWALTWALLAAPVLALTLTVDGDRQSVDSVTIRIIDNAVTITTDGQPQPPDPDPPPDPPPPTGCGPLPPGVSVGAIDWRNPGSQRRYDLGNGTLALRFTATANQAYAGQVATTHTTTNPTTRTVWISECPGAAPMSVDRFCRATGIEGVVVRWAQNADSRLNCSLQTNRTYYVNVRNASCAGNCPFFMQVYTNGRP